MSSNRHEACEFDYFCKMEIRQLSVDDYDVLVVLWERSVRSSHDFLREEDFEFYKSRLASQYFPNVELWGMVDEKRIAGFIGLSDMIEMLFVDPDFQGNKIGSTLLDFATNRKGMTRVDVNEQNSRALGFYLSKGFKISGRLPEDYAGKPYPILTLEMEG